MLPKLQQGLSVRRGGPFQKCTRRGGDEGGVERKNENIDPVPVRVLLHGKRRKARFGGVKEMADGLKRGSQKILKKPRKRTWLDGSTTLGESAGGRKCHGCALKAASPNFQSLSPKHPDRQSDTYSLPPPPPPTRSPRQEHTTSTLHLLRSSTPSSRSGPYPGFTTTTHLLQLK